MSVTFLLAGGLSQREARAYVQRDPALQVGQREGLLSVAAVGCADQVEQRLVLGDGKSWPWQSAQPTGAKFPANILISPTYGLAHLSLLVL